MVVVVTTVAVAVAVLSRFHSDAIKVRRREIGSALRQRRSCRRRLRRERGEPRCGGKPAKEPQQECATFHWLSFLVASCKSRTCPVFTSFHASCAVHGRAPG